MAWLICGSVGPAGPAGFAAAGLVAMESLCYRGQNGPSGSSDGKPCPNVALQAAAARGEATAAAAAAGLEEGLGPSQQARAAPCKSCQALSSAAEARSSCTLTWCRERLSELLQGLLAGCPVHNKVRLQVALAPSEGELTSLRGNPRPLPWENPSTATVVDLCVNWSLILSIDCRAAPGLAQPTSPFQRTAAATAAAHHSMLFWLHHAPASASMWCELGSMLDSAEHWVHLGHSPVALAHQPCIPRAAGGPGRCAAWRWW